MPTLFAVARLHPSSALRSSSRATDQSRARLSSASRSLSAATGQAVAVSRPVPTTHVPTRLRPRPPDHRSLCSPCARRRHGLNRANVGAAPSCPGAPPRPGPSSKEDTVAALTTTRRMICDRGHSSIHPPPSSPSAEANFPFREEGPALPPPSTRSWSGTARERRLTTTWRPCPPPGPPRKAAPTSNARLGALPDTVTRGLRCRIASAPPPKRRPRPPEGDRGALCEPPGPADCVRRVSPVSNAMKRGRCGSVPGTQAHVPKNARALRTPTHNPLADTRRRRRPSAWRPESHHARPDPLSAARQETRRLPRTRRSGVRD